MPRRSEIAGQFGWPRALSEPEAAAYVGVSLQSFRRGAGQMPKPFWIGRRKLWDRKQLDEAVDRLARGGAPSLAEIITAGGRCEDSSEAP